MKSYVICIFLCLSAATWSQQESQFINAVINPYMLNPAAGGMTDVMHFELSSRTQWVGYNGPQTFLLTGYSPFHFKKSEEPILQAFNPEKKTLFSDPKASTGSLKHVAGGRVMNEAIGPFSKTTIYGSYAIHLPFSKKINFGAGIGLGWSNFRIIQDRVVLFQENDAAYALFLGSTSGQNSFDANAGIVFYSDKWCAGFSTSQLFRNAARFDQINTESYYERHYFLTARYRFDFKNKFGIEPNVVLKMVQHAPASLDAGLRFSYNRSAWLGVQYRTSNAITFQLGANIVKNLYLSYGYELGTGKIKTASNGTHEIQLGIYLGSKRKSQQEAESSEEEDKNASGH